MRNSTWSATIWQLAVCCLVSGISFVIGRSAADALQLQLARAEAESCLQDWGQSMLARRAAVAEFVNDLGALSDITEEDFDQAARVLTDQYGFQSVEWNSRVTMQTREQFEREISARLGRTTRILERSANGLKHPPKKKVLYPTRFVYPRRLAPDAIGVHRANSRAYRLAADSEEPVLTAKRKPYKSSSTSNVAICLGLRDPHDPFIHAYALANLPSNLFDVNRFDASRRTIARIVDVTNSARPVAVASHQLLKGKDHALRPLWVADTSIRGSHYRAEFAQNPQFVSKLTMLPWFALAAGPVVVMLQSRGRWRMAACRVAELNDQLHEEIREHRREQTTLRNLLKFREQERHMIANEIHDGFVQEAFGAQMFLEALAVRLQRNPDDTAQSQLDSARELLQRCLAEARQLVDNLQPSVLEQLGFLPAIQSLLQDVEERYGISVALRHKPDFPDIEINTQRALYRMIQESLSNIRRHSGANEASITFDHDGEWIYLDVRDQGRGFNQEDTDDSGFGLRGIRDRADMLLGTAKIRSVPGEGTGISISVPYRSDRDSPALTPK